MADYITAALEVASHIISIAAVVAALTPSETDNKWVENIRSVVNLLGLNILNAKNSK